MNKKLSSSAELPKPGTYDIEVAEVLQVSGSFFAGGSEEATVKDIEGNIWAIPEDQHCDKLSRLVSRYDVKKGTKLRIIVIRKNGKGEITDVIVLKK